MLISLSDQQFLISIFFFEKFPHCEAVSDDAVEILTELNKGATDTACSIKMYEFFYRLTSKSDSLFSWRPHGVYLDLYATMPVSKYLLTHMYVSSANDSSFQQEKENIYDLLTQ